MDTATAKRTQVAPAKSPEGATRPSIDLGALLKGSIAPTMLRLGVPMLIVLVVQTFVGVAETYFVGFLGTDALAGVAVVFPLLKLMQMIANGGFGGGVASAIARARARVDTRMRSPWFFMR